MEVKLGLKIVFFLSSQRFFLNKYRTLSQCFYHQSLGDMSQSHL